MSNYRDLFKAADILAKVATQATDGPWVAQADGGLWTRGSNDQQPIAGGLSSWNQPFFNVVDPMLIWSLVNLLDTVGSRASEIIASRPNMADEKTLHDSIPGYKQAMTLAAQVIRRG